jgi:hypothetical protein
MPGTGTPGDERGLRCGSIILSRSSRRHVGGIGDHKSANACLSVVGECFRFTNGLFRRRQRNNFLRLKIDPKTSPRQLFLRLNQPLLQLLVAKTDELVFMLDLEVLRRD